MLPKWNLSESNWPTWTGLAPGSFSGLSSWSMSASSELSVCRKRCWLARVTLNFRDGKVFVLVLRL